MHRSQRIDELRGIAVLLVLISHLTLVVSHDFLVFEQKYLNLGSAGVMIFFCVSGYVITWSIRRHEAQTPVRAALVFGVRRLARLLPAYYILAILLWSIVPPDVAAAIKASMSSDPVGYWIRFLTMTAYLQNEVTIYHGADWTLTYELGFYIACTVVILIGSRAAQVKLLYVPVIAVSLATMLPLPFLEGQLHPPGLRYLFFLIGVVAYAGRALNLPRLHYCLLLAICCGTIVLRWGTWNIQYGGITNGEELAGPLAFSVFLLALHVSFPLPRLLSHIGLISYSVYLLHDEMLWVWPAVQAPAWARPLIWTGMSFAFATLSYLLIERPGVAVGRHVARRLRPPVSTA